MRGGSLTTRASIAHACIIKHPHTPSPSLLSCLVLSPAVFPFSPRCHSVSHGDRDTVPFVSLQFGPRSLSCVCRFTTLCECECGGPNGPHVCSETQVFVLSPPTTTATHLTSPVPRSCSSMVVAARCCRCCPCFFRRVIRCIPLCIFLSRPSVCILRTLG